MLTQVTKEDYNRVVVDILSKLAALATTDLMEQTYGITRTLTLSKLLRMKLIHFVLSKYCIDLDINHLTEQQILIIIDKGYNI